MTTPDDSTTGGCLCGAVRYRLTSPVRDDAAHCHCTLCRRAAGAVAVSWCTVAPTDFEWTRGTPALYRSTKKGERRFCATCGTPLTFNHADFPDELDVTIGSLDAPEAMPATRHIWTASRLPWLTLDPHLPAREDE